MYELSKSTMFYHFNGFTKAILAVAAAVYPTIR